MEDEIVSLKRIAQNIYFDIFELSNIELQKKAWSGRIHGYVSSYSELMCRLFNDNEFDIFIDSYAKQLGYHQNFIEKLKRLREMLNSYNEDDNKSDIEVINSQNWQKIADYAKLIIKEWNMDKLSFE